MNAKPSFSKSVYVEGMRCPGTLWYKAHRPLPKTDFVNATRDKTRAQGDEIGKLAQDYFGEGVVIEDDFYNLDACIASTQKYISYGHDIIFEAAAMNPADGTYSHIDILKKVDDTDEWDLIEVKSSTSVKDYHVTDLAFQYHVFTGAGYKIRNTFMMLVNNKYFRHGDFDVREFFRLQNITKRVLAAQDGIAQNMEHLKDVRGSAEAPSLAVSMECDNPLECAYKHHGHGIPDFSVFNVLSGKDAKAVVLETGSFDVADIPDDKIPEGAKAIDIETAKTGRVHVNGEALRSFVSRLQYPLYFLDYETIMQAVPLFDGIKPYRQIPFQFSLHVQDAPGSDLTHHEFIHEARTDPRRAFTEALLDVTGNTGTVIVYNAKFEMERNSELAVDFPEYADRLNALNARVVDLYDPFRERHLYHPDQQGSASIKKVLPAFTNLSYDGLGIGNGEQAMDAYMAFMKGQDLMPPQALFAHLYKYCGLDTYAMVELLDVVRARAFDAPVPAMPRPSLRMA